MKIYDKLDEILKNGSKIKILRFLFTEKDDHTGRRIARAIAMSASSTHKTLQEMGRERLITARRKGNAILYKLRTDNYVVKKLLGPLFEREKSIYEDIVLLIKKNLAQYKNKIISMAIFGSVARKEETLRSDIDLLILLKDENDKPKIENILDQLHIDMGKSFGVAISSYVLTKTEFKKKYNEQQPIIKTVLQDNKLIFGEPLERILA